MIYEDDCDFTCDMKDHIFIRGNKKDIPIILTDGKYDKSNCLKCNIDYYIAEANMYINHNKNGEPKIHICIFSTKSKKCIFKQKCKKKIPDKYINETIESLILKKYFVNSEDEEY